MNKFIIGAKLTAGVTITAAAAVATLTFAVPAGANYDGCVSNNPPTCPTTTTTTKLPPSTTTTVDEPTTTVPDVSITPTPPVVTRDDTPATPEVTPRFTG